VNVQCCDRHLIFPLSVQADSSEYSEVSEEEEEEDKMASDVEPEGDEPARSGRFQEEAADADPESPAYTTEGESPGQLKLILTCSLQAVFEPQSLQYLLLRWVCTSFVELSLGSLEQALW